MSKKVASCAAGLRLVNIIIVPPAPEEIVPMVHVLAATKLSPLNRSQIAGCKQTGTLNWPNCHACVRPDEEPHDAWECHNRRRRTGSSLNSFVSLYSGKKNPGPCVRPISINCRLTKQLSWANLDRTHVPKSAYHNEARRLGQMMAVTLRQPSASTSSILFP
jgi:hypothetical protein